ncbi:type II toxin-antitoxin system RelE/ParE family toxin [Deinococcus sp. VB343]|uniref:Type II toxin-antitoxin system RelE/ParE family toxin n=1 Tax=Deinococcus sp. VB142 TaxID=3112952 RepID=A0AAU6Q8H1_9DEIO
MSWEVEYTDELGAWWEQLSETEQESIDATVRLLEARGPQLGFPHSSGISTSRHSHMRELRIQHQGRPYRILYAFDPARNAILLIGGDKTGNDRWYDLFVPKADDLYDEHLSILEEEAKNGKEME